MTDNIFYFRLCELRKVNIETDIDPNQVPFELSTLPLQQLQGLVTTMLADTKLVIFLMNVIF